jgi:monomeric sarcosine oxidase
MKVRRREFAGSLAAGLAFRPETTYAAAVVGAGAFGSWIALHLARAGQSVVLLEAHGAGHSRASSGGESRVIRMGYGADEIYTRWSMRSLVLWKELFERTGRRLFHRAGVLWMAQQDHPKAISTRQTLEKCGVPFEVLDEGELRRRYPQMRFGAEVWGILEPDSGALMARRAVQLTAEEAARAGAAYVPQAVAGPRGSGRLDSLATSDGTTVRAETFIFASGPWLPKIFPDLLGKRIFPTRQAVLFFGAPSGDSRFASPALPVWIDFTDKRVPYGIPDLENRGFKIALDRHGPPFDADTGERLVTREEVAEVRRYLASRFPDLRNAPLVESRVCQYENTSSGDFLIDRHPDFENVWLAGGGSGHGFKHGPAVGEHVAALIAGTAQVEPRFSLATKEQAQKRKIF